jgi:hypothetical protein
MINRRHFLKGASLLTLGSLVACNGKNGYLGNEKTTATDLDKVVNKVYEIEYASLNKYKGNYW